VHTLQMDWKFWVGPGLAIIFGSSKLPDDMPHWLGWSGLTVGASVLAWGFLLHPKISPYWRRNIEINVGDAGRYRIVNDSDDGNTRNEAVLVQMKNTAEYELTNVSLNITKIRPFSPTLDKFILRKNISLSAHSSAHSENFSPVARLEITSGSPGRIVISQLIETDTGLQEMHTELSEDKYSITFLATAAQSRPREEECCLLIDKAGSLRLKKKRSAKV
jgi:hypothetical protein